MAKMVGMSRTIRLLWLNRIVDLKKEGLSDDQISEQILDYLSFEIKDTTNLNKTKNILMNTWIKADESMKPLQNEAFQLICKYPDDRVTIHWCMLLLAYPVFADACKLVGKMSEYQGEITLKNIKGKLYDEWGERSTLAYAIDKIVATFKHLGALENISPGKYQLLKNQVHNTDVVLFMIVVLMVVDDGGYYSFQDISNSSYFFPFDYDIKKENFLGDDRFMINKFGEELTISIKDNLYV